MNGNNEHNKNLQTIETLVSKWKEEGNTYYHQHNYQPAIEQYSKIIQLLKLQHSLFHPSSSSPLIDETLKQTLLNILYVSYSNRCACFLQLNNVPAAYQDAKECISLKAEWPKGYHRLANCLIRMEKHEEALVVYEQLLFLEQSPSQKREIQQSIQRLRQKISSSSSSSNSNCQRDQTNSSSSNSSRTTNPASASASASSGESLWASLSQRLGRICWQTHFETMQRQCAILYGKFLVWYSSLSQESRNYMKLAIFGAIVYYFFFSSGGYGSPHSGGYYQDDYGYYGGYPYSSYSRGLSWSAWIAIIAGAYYVPPMLPDILGDQFARPFFGLNFTTFLWLVQIFSNSNRGGGYQYYGRPRRRFY